MAVSPLLNVLPKQEPAQAKSALDPAVIDLGGEPQKTQDGSVLSVEVGDGSVVIDFNPQTNTKKSDKFYANLALEIEEAKLNQIASDLLRGVELDDQSRQDWLTMHAEGIKLLGLVVEDSKNSAGTSSAPLEGMSQVWHPLLLDACLAFQATARGELLPAAGPAKIRDDQPPMLGHNGGPPLDNPLASPAVPPAGLGADPGALSSPGATGAQPQQNSSPDVPQSERDTLANALERDFNHFLTVTAKEYVPDTDRMLFMVGFGGEGIKKVYNCPIRRRPVSESVNMEDFIVSNALTDLGNAARITHRSKMKPSTLKRLQLLGVYRDTVIGTPTQSDQQNAVDQAKAEVVGVNPQTQEPKDADHVIYEILCELQLDEYAPSQFKGKGLALPYRVTIEKDAKKVLEVRRNWDVNDKQCLAKEYFVEYPFVKAFGFYGIGLLHILGNTTKALTTATRELLDSGMFANFPGFLYAKGAGRQLTNQFRVAPGSGVGLDVGLQKLSDAVMPLPYKDLGPGFTAFLTHMEQNGQRLGGTAQISVGEGKQDAPVGTTLALIEQATKQTGAVMKRLHTAQSKEFQLLKERFQDDPEAFWRFNKRPSMQWQKDQFIQALNDFDLVPVSDPNNPTMMHRMAKNQMLFQIASAAPTLLNQQKVFLRMAKGADINDPEDLLAPPAPPQSGPPVDPHKAADLAIKAHGQQLDAAAQAQKSQDDLKKTAIEMQDRQADRAARQQLADTEQATERLRLASTLAIHSSEAEQAERTLTMKIGAQALTQAHDQAHERNMQGRQAITDLASQNPQEPPDGAQ